MALSEGGGTSPATSGDEGFSVLLRALDPDRDQAARKYEEIRGRLRRFFRWRGSHWPDELTDQTMDRVRRRLASGEEIRAADVGRYFLGVARNVLREQWRRERRSARTLGPDVERLADDTEPHASREREFECLERCLAALAAADRELVRRYYAGEAAARIESRRILASELGIPPPTLRIRLHRLRARLERCVRACLEAETPRPQRPHSSEDTDS